MKGKDVVHGSAKTGGSDLYETPQYIFEPLNAKWQFTYDPCTKRNNLLMRTYSTPRGTFLMTHDCSKDREDVRKQLSDEDGLTRSWDRHRVFLNPPYSNTGDWIEKALLHKGKALIVALIPARVDTIVWQELIFAQSLAVQYLRGRVKFELKGKPVTDKHGRTCGAGFPSALVYF